MLPLIAFTDDTSGNKSKKWHKFDSWSIIPAGLPRHETSKIPNIHFVCCSDVASAVDMCEVIVSELASLEKVGIVAYDVELQQKVVVLAPLMCILADNPRACELLNHLGGSSRRYCRMCMVNLPCDYNVKCRYFYFCFRLTEMSIQLRFVRSVPHASLCNKLKKFSQNQRNRRSRNCVRGTESERHLTLCCHFLGIYSGEYFLFADSSYC